MTNSKSLNEHLLLVILNLRTLQENRKTLCMENETYKYGLYKRWCLLELKGQSLTSITDNRDHKLKWRESFQSTRAQSCCCYHSKLYPKPSRNPTDRTVNVRFSFYWELVFYLVKVQLCVQLLWSKNVKHSAGYSLFCFILYKVVFNCICPLNLCLCVIPSN